MNNYTIEYDSHSIFLRQKSNEKMKERLDTIRQRKNVFLPMIKTSKIKNKSPIKESSLSKKHISVRDLGKYYHLNKYYLCYIEKSYEITMNNRRLLDRLEKIKLKENAYIKPIEPNVYKNNKKIYDFVQRKIAMDKITMENERLNNRISKL